MNYRQFNLINSEGETYRLTLANKHSGFLYNVAGMGADESAEFQQIGNHFGILSDKINQGTLSGTIKFFKPNAYQEYLRFVLFTQKKPLTMHYRTPAGEFFRDGVVTNISKSEGDNQLRADIEFTCTSLWYQEFVLSGTTSVNIQSESMNESGCHIIIEGPVNTPGWSQTVGGTNVITGALVNRTDVNGDMISAAISSGELLHIRTDTMPYRIYKTDSNGTETDLYGCSDWSTDRFCLIRYGENVISCNGATSITVEGRIEYETV